MAKITKVVNVTRQATKVAEYVAKVTRDVIKMITKVVEEVAKVTIKVTPHKALR